MSVKTKNTTESRTTIRLHPDVLKSAKYMAIDTDRSLNDVMCEAIKIYLNDWKMKRINEDDRQPKKRNSSLA